MSEYLDSFRNSDAAAALVRQIRECASAPGLCERSLRVVEVCGTHTMAITRCGIRTLLPGNVELISGPGCPVCVTDAGYIDAALELGRQGKIIVSFGDMLKVPGSKESLGVLKAQGVDVRVCYSPLDAVTFAEKEPSREVVFLGIGFETTAGPVVSIIDAALKRAVTNVSILTAFKLVPPALEILAADPEIKVDAYLCPAHVSAIIGSDVYKPVARRFSLPCVVAGFEPLDILYGVLGILEQIRDGRAEVENQYSRVVRPEGNRKAQALLERFLVAQDVSWRGLGVLAGSGLVLRDEFSEFDAVKRYGIVMSEGRVNPKCKCAEVLKGAVKPPQCELFGSACSPRHAIGPCMVSSEGSCAAYYKYSRLEAEVK